ncbi:hypothetical protein ECE50_024865 [Chitinophaga sp. Mgbs1]|uniref:RNA polymerase sigma-70 region 2 domain-containing protein n=1 Tax=Chitinophaga solisilvae TaxID=1233460 RepID=A0A9Q5D5P3_9BACT|nr:hypothetical protein [Chitinophaga solisilvae]
MLPGNNHNNQAWSMLRAGDQSAMLLLYDEHYTGLLNYGIKLTGNRELSAECITQVLIDLWDKRKVLPEVTNVRAYLLTCIRRKVMAELKAGRMREQLICLPCVNPVCPPIRRLSAPPPRKR